MRSSTIAIAAAVAAVVVAAVIFTRVRAGKGALPGLAAPRQFGILANAHAVTHARTRL